MCPADKSFEPEETSDALHEQREWLRVTLSSIGDAVITTDTHGLTTYLNPVAESLTGWTLADAVGTPLEEIFKIVNEETRETVENRATRSLREGLVVGLANHTLFISKDGTERAIKWQRNISQISCCWILGCRKWTVTRSPSVCVSSPN